jgi:hypothetical protein
MAWEEGCKIGDGMGVFVEGVFVETAVAMVI